MFYYSLKPAQHTHYLRPTKLDKTLATYVTTTEWWAQSNNKKTSDELPYDENVLVFIKITKSNETSPEPV